MLLFDWLYSYVVVDFDYCLLLCLYLELVIICVFVKFMLYFDSFFSCNCNFCIFGFKLVDCWCG